jgi:hypothetical protein
MTVPAPVCTPHPNGAATLRSTSPPTTTTLSSYARACVAKLDCPKKDPYTGRRSNLIVVDPSGRTPLAFKEANCAQ